MSDDEEYDSFRELVDDLALAKNDDMEPVEEPFEPIIEDLGLAGTRTETAEQVLVYRESPDRRCFVCDEPIPETGRTLDEGEQYVVQRANVEGDPFPMIERTFHVDCWDERRT